MKIPILFRRKQKVASEIVPEPIEKYRTECSPIRWKVSVAKYNYVYMDRKEAEGVIDFIKNAMETPLQKSITISDACSSETFLLSEIKTIYMAPVRIRLIYNSQNILVKSEMLNVNQNEIYFNGGVN